MPATNPALPVPDAAPDRKRKRSPAWWAGVALAILCVNALVAWAVLASPFRGTLGDAGALALLALFLLLAIAQFGFGVGAIVAGVRLRRATGRSGLGAAAAGLLLALGAVAGAAGGALLAMFAAGGGWGRPLRVRGRQLHPELREGSDWTAGDEPDPAGLDAATARALEALWLHDAQKEHASVPAFARVGWLLAAAGAPAELLAWSHRAALEEIDHARRCFALAAGYGGRSHTVEPMPELLAAGLDVRGNAFVALATESLGDGCLLEDFNADIAAECAAVCVEPATRAVLQQIAREERSHADFSWAVLAWALHQGGADVAAAVARAIVRLPAYRRPTAVSWQKRGLVAAADPQQLRRHGRLPDERWAALWQDRLQATTVRAQALLPQARAVAAMG